MTKKGSRERSDDVPMHTAHSIDPSKEGAYKATLFVGVVM
jgi:hypothetical protein